MIEKICPQCNILFKTKYTLKVYCCDNCKEIAWGKRNPEKVKERDRRWRDRDPRRYLLHKAKDNAKHRHHEFNLTIEDIIIPEYCPYLNVKLDPVGSNTSYVPSIDRVDNNLGYIKENIQVISLKANQMKSNASETELLAFAEARLYHV